MRRSPRNLKITCNHKGLTHFGGAYFFHHFLQLLQLRDFLARHLAYSRRNCRYTVPQMILALLYPIVLGLDRIETASFLRSNGTLQYLTGLPSFPIRKRCAVFCCKPRPDSGNSFIASMIDCCKLSSTCPTIVPASSSTSTAPC